MICGKRNFSLEMAREREYRWSYPRDGGCDLRLGARQILAGVVCESDRHRACIWIVVSW